MAGLSDDEMVKVTAVAPFEVANAFAVWSREAANWAVLSNAGWPPNEAATAACDGRGPPFPLPNETHDEFGLRMAAGLMHFLKES